MADPTGKAAVVEDGSSSYRARPFLFSALFCRFLP
jgi:hypothetical protein